MINELDARFVELWIKQFRVPKKKLLLGACGGKENDERHRLQAKLGPQARYRVS